MSEIGVSTDHRAEPEPSEPCPGDPARMLEEAGVLFIDADAGSRAGAGSKNCPRKNIK